jgi:hypothetical protein
MSGSASTLFGNHKSIFVVIDTGTSIKTDSITKLTRAYNYQICEIQVEYLLISIDYEEIVIENPQLPSDTTPKDLRLYRKIIKNSLAILIQTITPEILVPCPPLFSLHELRRHYVLSTMKRICLPSMLS